MAEKILTLSTTEFVRPVVSIDGEEYQMRAPEELTVAMQRDISKTVTQDTESDEDIFETQDGSLAMKVRVVMVGMPDEVLAKLSPFQKGQILRVFTQRVTDAIGGLSSPMDSPSPSPGASASTAAH